MSTSHPLDNFPLVYSDDIEDVRSGIARVYARPTLAMTRQGERLNTTVNNCRLKNVEVAYTTFGADVKLEFPPTGFVSQLYPLVGKGEVACGKTSIALSAGSGAIISPQAPHQANYSADYAHLILRIDTRLLTQKLAGMTGTSLDKPLQIDVQQSSSHPAARMLQQYLPLFTATLSGTSPPFPEAWVAQTEELLMTLLLCGCRHNYSHLLEQETPDAAPREVRLVEDYIEANAHQVLTMDDLAKIAGVSTFSLFGAFKRYRGYSPLNFLARVRARTSGVRKNEV